MRPGKRSWASTWSVSIALVALAQGCGKDDRAETGAAKPAARRGGTVTIAITAEPRSLMPYSPQAQGGAATDILGLVFDFMIETNPDLTSFSPQLAQSWSTSPDGKIVTFELDPKARWTDGVPLTAEDVQFSFEVARDSLVGWPTRRWKKDIESCEVVGPHTVRFRFKRAPREAVRFAREGFVIPKHLLAGVPRDKWNTSDFARAPIGSGPFRLESWEPQQRLVLVRNDTYRQPDQPVIDRIVMRVVPDKPTAVRLLRAGEIDFLDDLTPREAETLKSTPGGPRVVQCKGRDYDFIGYNLKQPRFQDVRVREALTRAIDRAAIAERLLAGYVEPLDGPIVPIMWAYDSNLPRPSHDPQAARDLLAAAGWRDTDGDGWVDRDGKRFEMDLLTNADNERRTTIAVPIQSDWKAIGVKAEVRTLERSTLLDLRTEGKFDAVIGGWGTNLAMELAPIWGCKSPPRNNFVGYCNTTVDSLIEVTAYLSYDEAKPPLHRMQQLIAQDFPYTFLYYTHYVVGVSPRLQNVVIDARATMTNPTTWWVTDGEVAGR